MGRTHRENPESMNVGTMWHPRDDTAGRLSHYQDPKVAPFVFRLGRLVQVKPENLLAFLAMPNSFSERLILLDGFRAWIACPSQARLTVHKDVSASDWATFVHSAMLLSATRSLSLAFTRSRWLQRNKKDWSSNALLNGHPLRQFSFDVFFALGGLSAAFRLASDREFAKQAENQRSLVCAVLAFVYALHTNEVERWEGKTRHMWGRKKATEVAAAMICDALTQSAGHRAHSEKKKTSTSFSSGTVNNYWDEIKQSAHFIYAAVLIDDERLLPWLLRVQNVDGEEIGDPPSDKLLAEWFALANEVYERILKPRKLGVAMGTAIGGPKELPLPPSKERLASILLANWPVQRTKDKAK